MKKPLLLLLLTSLFLAACPGGEEEAGTALQPIPIPEDLLGAAGSAGEDEEYAYPVIKELGIKWVTKLFRWSDIQKIQGDPDDPAVAASWDWTELDAFVRNSKQNGLKVIATIGCSDMMTFRPNIDPPEKGHYVPETHIPYYVKYVKKMVDHYSTNTDPYLRVDAWEIWNEGNYSPTWWEGTPQEFYKLHKAVAEAVREVNATVPLVGFCPTTIADFTDWSTNLIQAGAAPTDKLTGAAFHPYAGTPKATIDVYEQFRSRVVAGGFTELWVTEVGFPYGGVWPMAISPELNASYTAAAIALMAANGAAKIFWYEFSENGGANGQKPGSLTGDAAKDFERYFGLTWWWREDAQSEWQCAYQDSAFAFKLCAENIAGYTYYPNLPERGSGVPASVQTLYFKGKDGKRSLVIWNNSPSNKTLTVTLPGTDRILHDMEAAAWDRTNPYKPVPSEQPIAAETADVTIKPGVTKFYTWKNDTDRPPRISL